MIRYVLSDPESLLDLSSITRLQAKTLKIQLARKKNEINMQEAADIYKKSGIKRGSYHRVLGQAKNSFKESIFTVAFGVQLGLIKLEDVQKLISSAAALPEDMDPDRAAEILGLLAALADRIVMV